MKTKQKTTLCPRRVFPLFLRETLRFAQSKIAREIIVFTQISSDHSSDKLCPDFGALFQTTSFVPAQKPLYKIPHHSSHIPPYPSTHYAQKNIHDSTARVYHSTVVYYHKNTISNYQISIRPLGHKRPKTGLCDLRASFAPLR